MSKRLTIAQAQQQLPNLPKELINEPIIITQDGVPIMAAMSYTHLTELLETLDILTDRIRCPIAPKHHPSTPRRNYFLGKCQSKIGTMNHEENAIEYEIQLTPLALEMLAAVNRF